MHDACMATKTISLDLEAYERLRKARKSEKESFSQVIHRAKWPVTQSRCGDLLDFLQREARYLPAREVRTMEKAQALDKPPKSKWN